MDRDLWETAGEAAAYVLHDIGSLGTAGCQYILERWISEAIDAKDFERARRICDLYWDLWFLENSSERSSAA